MVEDAVGPPAHREASGGQLVAACGVLMILTQLAFRAWALYPSWFYTDDYRLLYDARHHGSGWDYLVAPFDNQFMPVGRALAWWVSQSGDANWTLAASVTVVWQLLASAACLWMLLTLFGPRWGILAPLGLYLTSAVTMPALMWWAAALNQLPLQVVFFAAVSSWVRYARTSSWRWLLVTAALLAFGVLCYVKTVLILSVLAFLLLAYFSSGGAGARLRGALTRYRASALLFGVLGLAFSVFYATQVPSIFQEPTLGLAGKLADTMIGTAFGSGVVGGPWRWDTSNPPTGYADPPAWAVHAAWVVIVLFGLLLALRRRAVGRGLSLLALYLTLAFVLVLTSRAPVGGAALGLEYRYLTDVIPVAALVLGLITMPLLGAVEPSRARAVPLLAFKPRRALGAAVALVCLGGAASSWSYAEIWHEDHPGEAYAHTVMNGLNNRGYVDLADQTVPANVIPGFSAPYNTTRRLLPLLVDNARFPEFSRNLVILDDQGSPRRVLIDLATTSLPGPVPGCGWKVTNGSIVDIPLAAGAFEFSWWIRIGYLGSASDTVTVRAGETTTAAPLRRGLESLFVHIVGAFDHVTLSGLAPGTTLCVDTIEVGQPVPGEAL